MGSEFITGDDFYDWAVHPTTRAFKKILEGMVMSEKLERNFTEPQTLQKDYFLSEGRCLGIESVISKINEYKENESDDE